MILELIRLEENEFYGTFGVLRIDKEVFCVTLEPSDQENAPFISSIPCQQYRCVRHNSPKYGKTFRVDKVPGRDNILFHRGNTLDDTAGCIILAEYWGKLTGDRAVLNSGNTFDNFMHIMDMHNIKHFKLTIYEVF
jgi:hypothetical protein